METKLFGPALVLLFGLGLIWGGYSLGPQGGYYLQIKDNVSEAELSAQADVVEYENLSPRTQEAFREALQQEAVTATPQARFESSQGFPSEMPQGAYVHYRDHYYKIVGLNATSNLEGVNTFLKWGGGVSVFFAVFWGWTLRN